VARAINDQLKKRGSEKINAYFRTFIEHLRHLCEIPTIREKNGNFESRMRDAITRPHERGLYITSGPDPLS